MRLNFPMGIETTGDRGEEGERFEGPMRLNFPMGIETSQGRCSTLSRYPSNETQLPNGN